MKTPEEILTHFPVRVDRYECVPMGHIHKTWKVYADQDYILQWVNPIFGPAVMKDISAITAHLKHKGITTFDIVSTTEGTLFVPDEQGFWRMFSCIPGIAREQTQSLDVVYEAGRLLGEFHAALADCIHTFSHTRSLHRNTPALFRLFKESIASRKEVFDENLLDAFKVIEDIPSLFLPSSLRTHVTHGDPKLSNMLFSETEPVRGIALVDLDECGNHFNVLVDLGDALRSWCQSKKDGVSAHFSVPLYHTALEGYMAGAGDSLTMEEKRLIPQAVKLITLELACRFARDIVEDSYFGWDETRFTSRKEHNRARVLSQVALYKELVAQEGDLACGL